MKDTNLKLGEQICFPIYTTSRLIIQAYKPFLDQLKITYPQYLLLLVLWENDGIAVNFITQKLNLNTNTVSPLIKRMVKMDLISKKRSEHDERTVVVQLTPKGKKLKHEAESIPRDYMNELINEDISTKDLLLLKSILERITNRLNEKK